MALGSASASPDGPDLAAAADSAARRRGLRPLQDLAGSPSSPRAAGGAVPIELAARTHDGARNRRAAIVVPGDRAATQPTVRRRRRCGSAASDASPSSAADEPVDLGELRPGPAACCACWPSTSAPACTARSLFDELWPDDDEAGAQRKLQVAISSIRRVARSRSGRRDAPPRRRLPARCRRRRDVRRPRVPRRPSARRGRSLGRRRRRRRRTRSSGAPSPSTPASCCRRTAPRSGSCGAPATPDGGDRHRPRARPAAARHAAPAEAVAVARRGLAVDRYSDPLWRLLARQRSTADGDLAEQARAVAHYDEVLAELGITPLSRSCTATFDAC